MHRILWENKREVTQPREGGETSGYPVLKMSCSYLVEGKREGHFRQRTEKDMV